MLAILIGICSAFYLFSEVKPEKPKDIESGNAIAVQIGVFKTEANAEKMKNTYGGMVFKDNELYRVYYSILNKDENIEFITNYLKEKGINYFLKSINVRDELLDTSEEIELLMSKTKKEAKLKVNDKLLNIYKEVV